MTIANANAASDSKIPAASGAFRIWLLALAAALTLYIATASHHVQWQDSGWQQWRIVSGDISHSAGLALTHPLQYYLGRFALRLLPFLEPAHAITLVSAVAGAVAVANLAALTWLLTRRLLAVFVCAGSFGLAHTVWQFATHTESYALVNALLTTEWLGLLLFYQRREPRWLLLTFAANGLGVANHLLALLATPIDIFVLGSAAAQRKVRVRLVLIAVALWIGGCLPYLGLVAGELATSADAAATLRSALFGKYAGQVLNTGLSGSSLALSAAFVLYNFPGLTLIIAGAGIWFARRNSHLPSALRYVWLAELAVYTLFVARYSIPDRYTFFGPVYALLALFAGLGLHAVVTSRARWRHAIVVVTLVTILWNPAVYWLTARVLQTRGALLDLVGNKPFRNGYRSFFVPWGVGDDTAARATRETLRLAGPEGVVLLQPNMIKHAFLYQRALGRVPDEVTYLWVGRDGLTPERLELSQAAFGAGRPIVLIPEDRDLPIEPLPGALWQRRGDLYRAAAIDPVSAATQRGP